MKTVILLFWQMIAGAAAGKLMDSIGNSRSDQRDFINNTGYDQMVRNQKMAK